MNDGMKRESLDCGEEELGILVCNGDPSEMTSAVVVSGNKHVSEVTSNGFECRQQQYG